MPKAVKKQSYPGCRHALANRSVMSRSAPRIDVGIKVSDKGRESNADSHKDGGDGDDGVESIHYTAVSGHHLAVILHTVFSLDKRCPKVTDLRNNRKDETGSGENKVSGIKAGDLLYREAVKHTAEDSKDDTADGSLHGLLGAEVGSKLMLAEESAGKVCKAVAHPCRNKYKDEGISTVFHISCERHRGKGNSNIAYRHKYSGNVGEAEYLLLAVVRSFFITSDNYFLAYNTNYGKIEQEEEDRYPLHENVGSGVTAREIVVSKYRKKS